MSKTTLFAALLTVAVSIPVTAQQKPAPKPPAKAMAKKAEVAEKKTEKKADKAAEKAAEQKKLMAEAKITEAAARATALSKVAAGSTVASYELERENGKLIYTYDLKVPGKTGIYEVNVDAITGKMVGKVEHEAPKAAVKAPAKPPVKK